MEIELSQVAGSLDHLSRLAWEGEEVTITKKGKPYLKLIPHPKGLSGKQTGTRGIGLDEQQTWVAPKLPETSKEIIESFEGKWPSDFC